MLNSKGLEAAAKALQEKYREFWSGSWPDTETSRELFEAGYTAYLAHAGEPVAYCEPEVLATLRAGKAANHVDLSRAQGNVFTEPLYAAPRAQARVKVKPLEWRGAESVWHKADAEFGGHYRITEYSGMQKPFKLETHGWWSDSPTGHYELLDEAKAAAQADYERRIRAALDEQGPATPADERVGEATVTEAEIKAFREKHREIFPRSHPDRQTIIELLTASKQAVSAASEAFRAALSGSGDGWRDMASAPKDGSRVLCWNEQWESPESGCLYGTKWAANSLAADKGGWKYQPTRWMPLQAAPASPAGGTE